MSQTDINPPRAFATNSTFTTKREFWNTLTKKWGPVQYGGGNDAKGTSGTETRIGLTTPNYVSARNTGNLPENNFTYSSTTKYWYQRNLSYVHDGSDRYEYIGGLRTEGAPRMNFPESIGGIRETNLENQVKAKIHAKMKDQQVNIAQTLGERDQVAKMFSTNIKRISQAYSHLKRGNFAKAAESLGVYSPGNRGFDSLWRNNQSKAIANGWLELSFGWKPLIQDISGSLERLEKTRREYVVITSRADIFDTSVEKYQSEFVDEMILYEHKITKKCIVKLRRTDLVLAELNSLGLTNPFELGWELTKFSFLIDWAVDVGGFLSQFDSTQGWSLHSAAISSFSKATAKMTHSSPKALPAGYSKYVLNGTASIEQIRFTRRGITDFAGLAYLPAFRDPTSMRHVSLALALLVQHKR